MSAISIAMSGMRAATARFDAAAENLAHLGVREAPARADPAPAANPAAIPIPKVYRPVRANLYALSSSLGGGVAVSYRQIAPRYFEIYNPASAAQGGDAPAAPVDAVTEQLEVIQAAVHYRMSIESLKAADQLQQAALDILA